jgi:hypothetical protein
MSLTLHASITRKGTLPVHSLRKLAESHFSCADRQKVSLPGRERVLSLSNEVQVIPTLVHL